MSQVSYYYWSLSQFLWHEATRSIATPPRWDASPSQVTPSLLLGFTDSKVSCPRTQHNDLARVQDLKPGPLDPESSSLTIRPLHLPCYLL